MNNETQWERSTPLCQSGTNLLPFPVNAFPPILYSIIIAQPSERKSPVMRFIKELFDAFESKYNKAHREEMYKAQQDIKAIEARVKAIYQKKNDCPTFVGAKIRQSIIFIVWVRI